MTPLRFPRDWSTRLLFGFLGKPTPVVVSQRRPHHQDLRTVPVVWSLSLVVTCLPAFPTQTLAQGGSMAAAAAAFTGGAAGSVARPVKRLSLDVPISDTAAAAAAADVQVTLTWDVDSDLDLFVIEPSGERIYYRNLTSRTGGALDIDSNANCRIDGKRVENIRWPSGGAPVGEYKVQVSEYHPCGTSSSNYTVRIVNGASVQTFRGTISGRRTIDVATFHRRAGDPPRPVEQTQTECLNDAGSSPSPNNSAWDPVVGPCVTADEADVASFENLVEACRVCWLLHGDGSAQMRMSSLTTEQLQRTLDCIIAKLRQHEGRVTTLAGVGFLVGVIAAPAAGATVGLGAFFVTMKLAQRLGISPVETLANGLARIFGVESSNLSGLRAGATADAGGYTLKVQSTNPDALAFNFAANGDVELHFGRSEPAAFVWTLMDDDTPIGSLVVPYTPRTANRPPQPVSSIPAQTLMLGGEPLTVDADRYFTDPDGDALSYAVSSDRYDVASVTTSGTVITVTALAVGVATVTVTAVDPGGLTAQQTFSVTAVSQVAADDRPVLEALYHATNGPGWTESTNWLTDAPLSDWYGVTTNAAGSVTHLSLDRNELAGPIPVELGNLSSLTSLNLSSNGLSGRIPLELGNLSSLTSLSLWSNDLSGQIPVELGNLSSLTWLSLSWNDLGGPIPVELGNLSSLTSLYLTRNELVGPVPAWLRHLTQLRSLSLSNNDLTGTIPAELGDLVNLEGLYLGWNQLTGPIPSELGRLANLRNLDLAGNRLSGQIPTALGGLANLETLNLGRGRWSRSYYSLGNELSGSIPSQLGELENLTFLDLGGNRLSGQIPTVLSGLVNLEYLNLGRNGLTGPIPSQLGSLANLRSLYLYATDLTGPIPVELGNLSRLRHLDLSYTWGLTGPLPAALEPDEPEGVDQAAGLEELDIFVTQTCAPVEWQDWLATIEFYGPLCEVESDVIDIAVVYTPAARDEAGGTAAVEAAIDLMIAETNQAYEDSGVRYRLALVARSEVEYAQQYSALDLRRLENPSDGYMDEVPTMRDETGADLVHLIVGGSYNVCGQARLPGALGVTVLGCGGGSCRWSPWWATRCPRR